VPLTLAELQHATPQQRARYVAAVKSQRHPPFDAKRLSHEAGYQYVKSVHRRNALRTPRRVGKTVHEAIRKLNINFTAPFANQLYVTDTLKNAKRRIWPTLKKLNRELRLGGEPNEVEAFMRFPNLPNEPIIYLGGAKDQSELDKLRGYEGGFKHVTIDEAQSIRQSIMTELVDDVIEPSLMDYNGSLDIVGTPGPICAGYFYDIDVGEQRDGWEHYFWKVQDNPFLALKSGISTDEYLRQLRERRKWTESTPAYVRQYLGQWVTDTDSLALHYDRVRNACAFEEGPQPGWKYVLAFDIGYEDADAIAILGWAPHERRLRLVKELITRKQGITELGNQLKMLWNIWHPFKVVGDLGALGKKIGEELKTRWQLPVEAADKARKAEHVGLLDDALVTGAFLAPPTSVFAEDCAIIQWDAEAKEREILRFDPSYHSDIVDAVLYGYRAAFHFLENPHKPEPTIFDSPVLKSLLTPRNPDGPDYR